MGDHYANIATYEVHLGGPELLYHARMSAAIVAFVIAALRFLGSVHSGNPVIEAK